VLGVATNIGFLRRLLAVPDVRAGRIDTGLVERELDSLAESSPPDAVLVAGALAPLVVRSSEGSDAWSRLVAWRHGGPAIMRREIDIVGHGRAELWVQPSDGATSWSVWLPGADAPATVEATIADADGRYRLTVDGHVFQLAAARDGATVHFGLAGESWVVCEVEQRGAGAGASAHNDGAMRSPMPGTVISVGVDVGDTVVRGQAVAVVEAMKMEHTLTAPFDGSVAVVHVAPGASVALDQVLLEIEQSSP
jgi:acetyl-CoA/propionyl-CoA carboxylase biotin carboxyl carrier protein